MSLVELYDPQLSVVGPFMSIEVDEHRELLADPVRVDAYRRALHEVVGSSSVVADIGSGSGILGMLACEAGAARVYSIEGGAVIQLARQVSKANGFEGRQIFVAGMSNEIMLPEPVDVIVCDQIGHFGCKAGLFEFFADARDRYMKPDGVMIPSHLDLLVAPIEEPEVHGWVAFWRGKPGGFDFTPAHSWSSNTGYPKKLVAEQLLAEPAVVFSIELATVTNDMYAGEAVLPITKAGRLHGLGGWFRAQLSASVTLTNSPVDTPSIGRRNAVFPIEEPVDVTVGDEVRVAVSFRAPDVLVNWNVEVWSSDTRKAAFRHSTFCGMLISREDLSRMRPDFTPTLTERGQARMTVLELCDGRRPLGEIETEMLRRHPQLFDTPSAAASFVAEVVTRYAR